MELHNIAGVERMKEARDVEGLIGALSYQDDANVRRAAAEALGQVGGSQAAEALVAALRDPDESVRKAAVEALGKVGDANTAKLLEPLVRDPDENVQRVALEAAIRIGGRKREVKPSAVIGFKIGFFLLGAVLWAIDFGLLFWGVKFDNVLCNALWLLSFPLFFFLIYLGLKGWDWLSQYESGTYEWGFKVMVFMFLVVTVIGMIPICYWTGKAVARWYYNRRA